jgi:hypothetical protein
MIRIVTNLIKPTHLRSQNSFGFAHDWSHIYDGIYKFEDPTLG